MSFSHSTGETVARDNSRMHAGEYHNTCYNGFVGNRAKPPNNNSAYERGLVEAAEKGIMKRTEGYLKFDIDVEFSDDVGRTALTGLRPKTTYILLGRS